MQNSQKTKKTNNQPGFTLSLSPKSKCSGKYNPHIPPSKARHNPSVTLQIPSFSTDSVEHSPINKTNSPSLLTTKMKFGLSKLTLSSKKVFEAMQEDAAKIDLDNETYELRIVNSKLLKEMREKDDKINYLQNLIKENEVQFIKLLEGKDLIIQRNEKSTGEIIKELKDKIKYQEYEISTKFDKEKQIILRQIKELEQKCEEKLNANNQNAIDVKIVYKKLEKLTQMNIQISTENKKLKAVIAEFNIKEIMTCSYQIKAEIAQISTLVHHLANHQEISLAMMLITSQIHIDQIESPRRALINLKNSLGEINSIRSSISLIYSENVYH